MDNFCMHTHNWPDFSERIGHKTGLWTRGGPFCLVYVQSHLLECAMMTSYVRKFGHCPILGAICSPMVRCCRGDLCSSWCCLLLRELWTEVPPLVAPHYGSIQGDESSSSSLLVKTWCSSLVNWNIQLWKTRTGWPDLWKYMRKEEFIHEWYDQLILMS